MIAEVPAMLLSLRIFTHHPIYPHCGQGRALQAPMRQLAGISVVSNRTACGF